ncbi:hypothetical protein D9R14_08225 [Xanthobacter tagetidis]|uniref:Uncharacterized protein n=2 Tax=Xanthobacter tagetidis TaxID=60216 RepID=A0A3L7AGX1_9HYPH|nr:hypothetical protein D9R14_08225 [Xanthobacter tagetidis]
MKMSEISQLDPKARMGLRQAYVEWIDSYIEDGYTPYLMTFMFNHVSAASMPRLIQMMYQDIEIFYLRLSGRFAHHPEKPGQRYKLPILICSPDTPNIKRRNHCVESGDGLHVHGIFLKPPVSRFKGDLIELVRILSVELTRQTRIQRIHLVEVTYNSASASDYALKAFGRHQDCSEPLILPMEMGAKRDRTARGYDEACDRVQGSSLMRSPRCRGR